MSQSISRRRVLSASAAAIGAAAVAAAPAALAAKDDKDKDERFDISKKPATGGKINHSIVKWCFNMFGGKWDLDTICQHAKKLGCKSVELIGPDEFATVKRHGLTCAIANNGMPGAPFIKGLNNPAYQAEVIERTSAVIDAASSAGIPSVIAFTGFIFKDVTDPNKGVISADAGATHTVEGLKKLARLAERKNVTVCLEHLNSRVDDHPMKGHPGYQGDHVDYCFDIIRRVGSERVKLLFDIYHVQIMDGDVVRRIRENAELIGHIHTAGNPGRLELNGEHQEIRYNAIMRALVAAGYKGYVGHEFIPTEGVDPYEGLWHAVRICDV